MLVPGQHSAETPLAVGDGGEGIQQFTGRSGQPVEPGHDQHVPGGKLVECAPEGAKLSNGAQTSVPPNTPFRGIQPFRYIQFAKPRALI